MGIPDASARRGPRAVVFREQGIAWFDPRAGRWEASSVVQADGKGEIQLPAFPGNLEVAGTDWAAKLTLRKQAP
jgi:hypothetical protein